MTSVQMRTFPSLFVGGRTLLSVDETPRDPNAAPYLCGACDDELVRADRSFLTNVVVKCRCGEFNQL